MSFKPGDKVCYSTDYFEGSKNELIAKYGIGIITSEAYTNSRPHIRLHLRLRPLICSLPQRMPHPYFINVKWNNLEEECWECVDYLCLVEEREKRDIYALFEQEMNY